MSSIKKIVLVIIGTIFFTFTLFLVIDQFRPHEVYSLPNPPPNPNGILELATLYPFDWDRVAISQCAMDDYQNVDWEACDKFIDDPITDFYGLLVFYLDDIAVNADYYANGHARDGAVFTHAGKEAANRIELSRETAVFKIQLVEQKAQYELMYN